VSFTLFDLLFFNSPGRSAVSLIKFVFKGRILKLGEGSLQIYPAVNPKFSDSLVTICIRQDCCPGAVCPKSGVLKPHTCAIGVTSLAISFSFTAQNSFGVRSFKEEWGLSKL
jgi:hypothetical protein